MFALKTDRATLATEARVTFESLSSYDLNVGVEYPKTSVSSEVLTLRYEGEDGESLLEVYLSGSLIKGIGLVCFNGVIEAYDAKWTRPESVEDATLKYQLSMDEKICELRVVPYEIDQRRDFSLLVYTDAVVFLTGKGDVYSSNRISDELYVLSAKNGLVIGYAIASEEEAARFKETYG